MDVVLVLPHDWTGSVFFVFLDKTNPVTSATTRVLRSQHHGGTTSHSLEVTGTGFAINPRRFITCHHNVFNETTSTNCDRVAICTDLKKNGNQIIPHPQSPSIWLCHIRVASKWTRFISNSNLSINSLPSAGLGVHLWCDWRLSGRWIWRVRHLASRTPCSVAIPSTQWLQSVIRSWQVPEGLWSRMGMS
jgi:hypothetical protein